MTREQFKAIFCIMSEGYSNSELADLFEVAETTIVRWKNGVTCPAPRLRESIADTLLLSKQKVLT